MQKKICCGVEYSLNEAYCSQCGNLIQAKEYCPACNTEIRAGVAFCGNCGQTIAAPMPGTMPFNNGSPNIPIPNQGSGLFSAYNTYTVTSIIASFGFIICLFLSWIEIPVLQSVASLFGSDSGSYSILGFMLSMHNIVSTFGQYSEDLSLLYVVIVILIIPWGLSLFFFGKYIYLCLAKQEIDTGKFKLGLTFVMILFAICFIAMIIINMAASEETSGYISNVFSLTFVAYLTFIAALLVRFMVVKKIGNGLN